jgi:hypothetical protein
MTSAPFPFDLPQAAVSQDRALVETFDHVEEAQPPRPAKLDFNTASRQGAPDRSRVDAEDIKSRLNADIKGFLRFIYGGRVIFSSHDARIGDVHGTPGESLSIALHGAKAGNWYDHATGDGGGNLVDLYMAYRGYGQKDFGIALREIAHDFFGDSVEIQRHPSKPSVKEQIAEKKRTLGDKPNPHNIELGAPVESYIYPDHNNKVITVVRRYEPGGIDEKTGKPIKTFRADPGMPTPRILYRLPQIIKAEHVVLTEGERKADALASLGIEATTAMGGANTDINKVDWSPLAGKIVTIWPDKDDVGKGYAERVAPVLSSLGCRVTIVTPPADKRAKWDAYDCIQEGGDPAALIDAASPIEAEKAAAPPDEKNGGATPPGEDPRADAPSSDQSDGPSEGFEGGQGGGTNGASGGGGGPKEEAPEPTTPDSPITATPWTWRDPATIPPREWLYGRHFIRKFMSCTIAPGGLGKSSLALVEAIAMATGRNLVGFIPVRPLKVWYWNGEDPAVEIERRIAAILLHYGIDRSELEGRLFIDSGRDQKIVIARKARGDVTIAHPLVDEIKATIRKNGIDAFIIDPFVRCHEVSENDNSEIEPVAAQWADIADSGNCAVELVHHSRKTGGGEVTVEHSRGGICLIDKSRSARALNPMSKEEAEKAGVEHPRYYFRVDNGKANLAPPADNSTWYRLKSVNLGNSSADYPAGDDIQVVTSWKMPDPLDSVTVADLLAAQKAVAAGGPWREDQQAKDWVGYPIAAALRLAADSKSTRAKVKRLLKIWIENGAFKIVEGTDTKRNKRKFVEVGEWAT